MQKFIGEKQDSVDRERRLLSEKETFQINMVIRNMFSYLSLNTHRKD
jgi:hypothetical protein